jgi:hypothetical protein
VTKSGAECFIEPTSHYPPAASCNRNEWWQYSLEHDACRKFVMTGPSDHLSKATVTLGIDGFVTKTASLEYLIKLSDGAAGETPLIYVSEDARLDGESGPFGNELLDHGRLTRGMTD